MCMPWLSGQQGSFLSDMGKWLKEGKVQVEETTFDGVAAWPFAFQALFTRANKGKVVVNAASD
jgi:NADPH-dependent curcumin reductase CurA